MEEQKNEITKNPESKEVKTPKMAKDYGVFQTVKSKKVLIVGLLALTLIATALFFLQKNNVDSEDGNVLSSETSKGKLETFINENLMPEGSSVTIKEFVADENYEDLYRMLVDVGNGQEPITSYLTKDGKKFFPQVIDIKEMEDKKREAEEAANAEKEKAAAEMEKNDKPVVEIYVMSHCPYGTQIEKGILPVLETLGDKIDFELKFCTYAMHGEKELREQMRHYCIQKEEPAKLESFLNCFLEADESDKCVTEVGINSSKLASCVAATDKEYKVMESFNNKDTWLNGRFPIFDVYKKDNEKYGITGSPGLVINGKKSPAGRDSKSLLEAICSGFNEQPEECNAELSSTPPSPGFGFSGEGNDTDASCE
ncbi:MAG: hypothetical protein U9N04_01290 [Patescibacteria group bacterium]|nr:hypothetical protein [Patescibacteria group bacterium]